MADTAALLDGLAIGESPRWHDGLLWLSNWTTQQIVSVGLSAMSKTLNEIVVDGRGNVYVNAIGFDMMAGEEFSPGNIVVVRPDGSMDEVAGELAFPNGMAVTSDNSTLIVAESYGNRLTAFTIGDDGGLADRRVWADLGEGVPDGICLDAEGAVWYADVPNQRCVRVREGGEELQTISADCGGASPACPADRTARRCSSRPRTGVTLRA